MTWLEALCCQGFTNPCIAIYIHDQSLNVTWHIIISTHTYIISYHDSIPLLDHVLSYHLMQHLLYTTHHNIRKNWNLKSNHPIGICGNIASLKVRLLTPCTRLWEGAKSLKQQAKIYDNTATFRSSWDKAEHCQYFRDSRLLALQPFTLRFVLELHYELKFRMTSWVPDVRGRRVVGPPGWVDAANHKRQAKLDPRKQIWHERSAYLRFQQRDER